MHKVKESFKHAPPWKLLLKGLEPIFVELYCNESGGEKMIGNKT